MSKIVRFLGCLGFCLACFGAYAESRYQAVPINAGSDFGTEKALILDTMEGHLWIWTESPATDTETGGRYIIYQGQLFPGKEIGDVVLKQEWSPPAAPATSPPP